MALLQKSALRQAAPGRPNRASVVVRASSQPQDRRAFLSALVGGSVAAIAAAPVNAMELPWQKSTGGQGIGGGSMTKSGTEATASGYALEGYPGTKKPSYISPKEKRLLRQEARERAEKGMPPQ